jgi:hypothetical protein
MQANRQTMRRQAEATHEHPQKPSWIGVSRRCSNTEGTQVPQESTRIGLDHGAKEPSWPIATGSGALPWRRPARAILQIAPGIGVLDSSGPLPSSPTTRLARLVVSEWQDFGMTSGPPRVPHRPLIGTVAWALQL